MNLTERGCLALLACFLCATLQAKASVSLVFAGDTVMLGNNSPTTVSYVDYTTGNGIIYLTSNLTQSFAATLLSVNRTLSAQTSVRIYGASGQQYIPQLATESGETLITEDDRIILLG